MELWPCQSEAKRTTERERAAQQPQKVKFSPSKKTGHGKSPRPEFKTRYQHYLIFRINESLNPYALNFSSTEPYSSMFKGPTIT